MPVIEAKDRPAIYSHERNPRYAVHWTSRVRQFPYGWYWRNFRWYRFFWYITAGMVPVMWGFHKMVNSRENVQTWHHIHHAEHPMPFAPVVEPSSRHKGKGFPYFDPKSAH